MKKIERGKRIMDRLVGEYQPSITRLPLGTYFAGLKGVDLDKVKIAGEDLAQDVMNISIVDLPMFLKQGARLKLKMSPSDIQLLKDFIDNQ